MARVTVEDCITQIPNRFKLVTLAARRAKAIASGAPLTIDRDNDKDTVVALREIADLTVDLDNLEEDVIQHFQQHLPASSNITEAGIPADEVDEESGDDVSEVMAEESQAIAEEDADSMTFADENVDVDD